MPPADESPGSALITSFERLTDKAILAYRRGRLQLRLSARGQDFSRLLPAMDHVEPCVGATHRAWRLAAAMRRNRQRQLPEIDRRFLPPGGVTGCLTRVPNAIEHADDELVKGPRPLHQPAYLAPMGTRLQVLGESITCAELADISKRLYLILQMLNAAADERHLRQLIKV